MQSRFDHLIHKHDGQLKRRSVPGAFLAAAAIVAAVLFLLTPTPRRRMTLRRRSRLALSALT